MVRNSGKAGSGGTRKPREDVEHIRRGLMREMEVLLDELMDEVYGPVQPAEPEIPNHKLGGKDAADITGTMFPTPKRFK